MTVLLAIDPGTTQSGFVVFDGQRVIESGVHQNEEVLRLIAASQERRITSLAIEMIACYGMGVGREVFETCVWIGRFKEAWNRPDDVRLVYRAEVKKVLCHTHMAKDANVRQAILDLYPRTGGGATPQVGTKGKPGPLYGMHTHAWAALGVAITVQRQC